MTSTPPNVARILECLKKQKDCYTRLLAVAQRQKDAVESENDQALSEVMKDKNLLLADLQKLEEEIQPLIQNLTEADRDVMIGQGLQLKNEAEQVLKDLIAVEDASAEMLRDKKEKTFEQMKAFKETQKGIQGYKDAGGKPPRFSRKG